MTEVDVLPALVEWARIRPGTTLLTLTERAATEIPQGSILEADNDISTCVAYKISKTKWTITGHGTIVSSHEMAGFPPGWRVIRIGEH